MSILYLFLCSVLLCSVPTFAYNKATCQIPDDVISTIQNRNNLTLQDTKISIFFDSRNTETVLLPNNIGEISLKSAKVLFKSIAVYKEKSEHDISLHFDTEDIRILYNQHGLIHHCKAHSSDNFGERLNLNNNNEKKAVIELIQYCIQNVMCEDFYKVVYGDWKQNSNEKKDVSKKSVDSDHRLAKRSTPLSQNLIHNDSCTELLRQVYKPQSTINAMMDFGVAVLITKLDSNKNGVFDIPEINANFSVGASFYKVTGEVVASNGKFWDFRKVKRETDMIFTNEGRRFSVGSTYSLSGAKITFNSYKVRFGLINVSGEISADIGKLSVKAKASFDFNNKPCKATLDEFKIDGLDKLNVKMTGLAPLNGAAADIIKGKIQSQALDSLKDEISKQLQNLQCEKFRPT